MIYEGVNHCLSIVSLKDVISLLGLDCVLTCFHVHSYMFGISCLYEVLRITFCSWLMYRDLLLVLRLEKIVKTDEVCTISH